MKIKAVVIALFLAAGTVYAEHPNKFGIGIQGAILGGAGFNGFGGELTLKFKGEKQLFWAIGPQLYKEYFRLNLSGDYYLLDKFFPSMTTLGGYVGIGVGLHTGFGGENVFELAGALRIPIGLTFQPADVIEIYLQIVPQLGIMILPTPALWSNFWGGSLGVRLWL
jgi:hypothetical protein